MMNYPVAIEPGNETTAWGVVVPDLPGCFSAADTGLDEALVNVREAIELWMEDAIAHGEPIPRPSSVDALARSGQFEGWIWAVVQVDPAWADERAERVNITLPQRVLAVLDRKAGQSGASRSGYIAQLALQAEGRERAAA